MTTGGERTPIRFVGAGPGDPGLLPLRGQRALAEADVVVFDAAIPPGLLDLAAEAAERVPVGAAAGEAGGVPAGSVPALLMARAAAGRRVVRLLAGDATTFGDEAVALARSGQAFEVVPGVTPAVAGAIWAGIPLRDGTGQAALRVSAAHLAETVARLLRRGRSAGTPAALVLGAGTPGQRTLEASLGDLPAEARRHAISGEAVLVVGDTVRLRAGLAWFERRPLFGRRVLVTRPRHQAARFAELLEAYGAEVIAVPTIRLEPPEDFGPLDSAIGRLGGFRWVIFTSANGVVAFRERLAEARLDARALAGARLAAIGPETAETLARAGLRADVVPREYRAEGLVEALRDELPAGSEVLLVRATEARDVVPRELAALGAEVTVAPAYRTVPVKEGADLVVGLLEGRRVDVVTFTSSSTVRAFIALLAPEEVRRLLGGVVLAAIGPVTAATIAEYGLEARIAPRQYTIPALASAIAAHFTPPGKPA